MGSDKHHFKVGLFVVLLTTVAAAFLIWVGASGLGGNERLHVAVYFDESVQGLSAGSEVKYRGFKIGEVAKLDLASDKRHLEAQCTLSKDFVSRIGALTTRGAGGAGGVPIATMLIATLSSSGLTGLKFVDIDLREGMPDGAVALPVGVRAPEGADFVIPSEPSTLTSVERAISEALEAVKMHGPNVGGIIEGLNRLIASLNDSGVTTEATTTIRNLDQRIVDLDTRGLSDSAKKLFQEVSRAVEGANGSIQQLTAEDGDVRKMVRQIEQSAEVLSTNVERADLAAMSTSVQINAGKVGVAADAVADAAVQLSGIIGELDQTLKSVRLTVDELRNLIIVIEQEPSSLLFGREHRSPPPKGG